MAVDPAVSLSTYSTLPMEVVPWPRWPRRAESTRAVDDGEQQGLGRGWRGAGEDAAVDAHAERSTRVHWFGCGVRLPSPQELASGGSSRGRWGLIGNTAGHWRQEQAVSLALVWAAGARRAAIEEVAGPFDSNPTVTAARIICWISWQALRTRQLSRPTGQPQICPKQHTTRNF